MTATVTAGQLKALWLDPRTSASIDRGEDYAPITANDITALVDGGGIEPDDDGTFSDDNWQTLADQFNTETPGEPTGAPQAYALDAVSEADARLDQARSDAERIVAEATAERREAVVHAIAVRTPVTAIAARLGVKRARVYQIRDGVR